MKTNRLRPYIAVIDCNNFFVSCERVFRPDLAKKPVVVLSSNDGCVVARSQEVKDIGVPMGIPVFQIRDIIKDNAITLFSSNFTLYRDFSRRVFALVQKEFSQFEQYSIDEAFVVMDGLSYAEARTRACTIKDSIARLTGIPVSIGIGHSKTQAKYASTRAKRDPQGVFVCDEVWWRESSASVPIGDIWGVGRQWRERYHAHQIFTVEDLCLAPFPVVQKISGVVGVRLQLELKGTPVYEVETRKKLPKSCMSSRSFGAPVTQKSVLIEALSYHLQHVVADLERQKLVATTVVIYFEKNAFHRRKVSMSYPLTLVQPTRNASVLLAELLKVVDKNFQPAIYKKAGVLAGGLLPDHSMQPTLFPYDTRGNGEGGETDPHALLFDLQRKFSHRVISLGSRSGHETVAWQSRKTQCSPAYTTNWQTLQIVTA